MKILKAFWKRLSSPSKAAAGVVLFLGFAGGLLFWGAFNTGMEATNTEEFCSGCHAPIVAEIQETIHYSNRSGVRAICSDCHVPHEWTDKIVRKVQASKELFAHFVTKTIDTPEKFQERRGHLAEREWARMKKNDSLECRNCHEFDFMDYSQQGSRAAEQHSTALASGEKTCVDCHKGIAHKLPDMSGVEGWH
ncbi:MULTISPECIES: NapC/NirT family cytochrome c [Vibrio]|jgi:cytochrome c-type protein NapC|uniref:Cytochrome c-type protein n=7 Tax=Vibrio harveyi group TaxID=717610 RepID=A0A0H0YH73_VIBAL|nr:MULTISPECIES: NapC/NirT family cytochrome c [Vibrio]MDG2788914.1 NapC/NirT family cytochrome c [Vibrio parahaemolyticus]MDW1808069.1 NapC/NirT family cytochrome c [Vibrio sp. Vb2362]MDW1968737.1 NapC/NirT family cytochrome c [Vibrio sp. 945]MDW2257293.1 NapC/NirT family cytochrome c [Vibrio sp. 1409]MDW2294426.1 NapC/NirT family cytochrome c [Vibrio sp. 1404]NAW52537.1 cytochrome C [Vibrio sp. V41_P2S12T139]NAW93669.1 cytochrome C [Vibrio sp. V42_P2S4T144]QCO88327.1 cytochrome C [Vibrio 